MKNAPRFVDASARRWARGLATFAAITLATPAAGQSWTVTDYEVSFEIRNAGLSVQGTFEHLEASIDFDPTDPASANIVGEIDPASIETGIAFRDRHLQGRQFFDVARFPRITLRSQIIEVGDAGEFRGAWFLKIRDVEKRIPLIFRFRRDGPDRAIMEGWISVDRVAYGIGDAGFILDDRVTVTVTLQLASANRGDGLE